LTSINTQQAMQLAIWFRVWGEISDAKLYTQLKYHID